MAKKTRAVLESENKLLRQFHVTTNITTVIIALIKYGCIVLVVYYIQLSIAALAGKHTDANVFIKFLGNVSISQSLAYAFGSIGIAYGLAERKTRKNATKHLHGRIKPLELKIDKRRSSSNLTESGDTNPEDDQ